MRPIIPESPQSALRPELADIADQHLEEINHRLLLNSDLCPKRQSRLSLVLQLEFWQGAWQTILPRMGREFSNASWAIRLNDDPLTDDELDAAQLAGRRYAERLKSTTT